MKLKLLLVLSMSTFMFACSNESNTNVQQTIEPINQQDLQKNWQLMLLDNKPIKANSSLNIDELETATGNLACNSFFGAIELQDNKMRINKMVSTRKMCEPNINTIEMTVSATLANWSQAQISEEKLVLTGDRHTLIYHQATTE